MNGAQFGKEMRKSPFANAVANRLKKLAKSLEEAKQHFRANEIRERAAR
jgi:hypothetical protein